MTHRLPSDLHSSNTLSGGVCRGGETPSRRVSCKRRRARKKRRKWWCRTGSRKGWTLTWRYREPSCWFGRCSCGQLVRFRPMRRFYTWREVNRSSWHIWSQLRWPWVRWRFNRTGRLWSSWCFWDRMQWSYCRWGIGWIDQRVWSQRLQCSSWSSWGRWTFGLTICQCLILTRKRYELLSNDEWLNRMVKKWGRKWNLTSVAGAGVSADNLVGSGIKLVELMEVTGLVVAFPSQVVLSLL